MVRLVRVGQNGRSDADAPDLLKSEQVPLAPRTLFRLLREAAGGPDEPREPAPAQESLVPSSGGGAKMPILLVEDSAPNRLVATAILSKAGYRVEAAENGLQAVSAVRRDQYGLVLMDVAMPEMDGLEATRTIRGLEGERGRVPIVAMTAGAFDEDRQRCLDAGMNDFVSKPVVRADLLKAVERWLEASAVPESRGGA
jgi:CheY-like chemotaxis protein